VKHRVTGWFDGYAFDLDGTLYLGDRLLPDAAEVVRRIRQRGAGVVFITNKPLDTAAGYARKLTGLGIPAAESDVVTAVDSLLMYLEERHAKGTILPVTEPLVADVLARHGYALTADPARATVVVASFDRTFDYAKLNAAYRAIRLHGAVMVATNPDPYCPTPDGGLPDCAAMVAAIEACTGVKAEAVLGKPSPYMAKALLARLGVAAGSAAVVGDRITTDVAMAQRAGLAGVLVLTGATRPEDIAGSPVIPDYVIEGLHQLLPDTEPAPAAS
jgi:HAD superfamily hydrolase (TIGR01450 family)